MEATQSKATQSKDRREFADGKMIAEKENGIGWMIFNNPARHNAVSLEMFQAVPEIVADFEADDAVRVIIVRGAGDKSFISGADISQFEKVRSSSSHTKIYDQTTEAASNSLFYSEMPTVAMINGYCIGGGVSIAMSCDLRIASDKSRFAVPAAKLGVGYRAHGIRKLMGSVSPAFVKEIFFTARQFSAEEALAMGWVNRVLPEAQLEDFTQEYAGTIAANAPLTIRAVKAAVTELMKDPGDRDLEHAEALVSDCFKSEDYVEGRRAFMEKRPPRFQGK